MILSYPLTTVDRPTDRPLTIVKCIFFLFFRGILYIIFRIIVYINEKELGQLGQLVLVIRCNRLHLMPLSSCRDDSDMVVVLEHLLG